MNRIEALFFGAIFCVGVWMFYGVLTDLPARKNVILKSGSMRVFVVEHNGKSFLVNSKGGIIEIGKQ